MHTHHFSTVEENSDPILSDTTSGRRMSFSLFATFVTLTVYFLTCFTKNGWFGSVRKCKKNNTEKISFLTSFVRKYQPFITSSSSSVPECRVCSASKYKNSSNTL